LTKSLLGLTIALRIAASVPSRFGQRSFATSPSSLPESSLRSSALLSPMFCSV